MTHRADNINAFALSVCVELVSVAELCVFQCRATAKWFIHKWPEGGSSAANKCEHSISHSECALKAIYIVKSNYPSSMREYLISILNRAEHIIKKKKKRERERERKKEGRLFLDEGGLLNRGISLYTIQHSRFNYFPTQMKRGGGRTLIYLCPGRQCGLLRQEEKSKRGELVVDNGGRTKSRSFCCFFAFKANLKFLVVDLLTSLFLSEVLFLTATQS